MPEIRSVAFDGACLRAPFPGVGHPFSTQYSYRLGSAMRNEPSKWITKSARYIRSAELLMKDGDIHSAASWIYYAMFYCADSSNEM
jgi:hypothetical protein